MCLCVAVSMHSCADIGVAVCMHILKCGCSVYGAVSGVLNGLVLFYCTAAYLRLCVKVHMYSCTDIGVAVYLYIFKCERYIRWLVTKGFRTIVAASLRVCAYALRCICAAAPISGLLRVCTYVSVSMVFVE
jgi:hypothetical protein